MSIFQVLDNNRPAQYPDCKVSKSWNNSKFNSFEEAQDYANKWLGEVYGPVILTVNIPWDYNGYGDKIEIRQIG